jgi:hypothetical protein
MVAGLSKGRVAIKFRRMLPIAALLFVTISTYRFYQGVPRLLRSPGGRIVIGPSVRPRPMVVAQAVNLPAFILVLPLELAIFGSEPIRTQFFDAVRVIEFSVLGMLFWFYIGRFVDDAIAWRKLRSGSRWRLMDCVMAGLIAAEATLIFVVFLLEPKMGPDEWILAGAIFWGIVGYSAFFFRIAQFRAYPRMRAAETDPDPSESEAV